LPPKKIGIIPFSGLVANAISQDGDALLPLIAMDKKAAFFCDTDYDDTGNYIRAVFYWIEALMF
jgi:hypothetical protein